MVNGRGVLSQLWWPGRGGLIVNYVALSILLVVVTAVAVGAALSQALTRQIDRAADVRLADGAAFFQARLSDTRSDLTAAGTWLQRDPLFLMAIQQHQSQHIRERLSLALQFEAIDELLVADRDSTVLARVQMPTVADAGTVLNDRSFVEALSGQTTYGITHGDGNVLQQQVSLPVLSDDGRHVVAVLRVVAYLDQRDVDVFRLNTGLGLSLFIGPRRMVTSLRTASGAPLNDVGADASTVQNVEGHGQSLYTWRDLPTGSMRSYYVPFLGPNGQRVGMLAVALPLSELQGEWGDTVLSVLPIIVVVVLAGGLLALLLAHRVRAPILTLAAAATRLRDGDLATVIPPVNEPILAPLAAELEHARQSVHATLEAIANAEARQRALLAALREPILTTSPSGSVSDFNPAAMALLGNQSEVRGRPIQELLPFVTAPPEQERGGDTWVGRLPLIGHTRDLEVMRTRLTAGHLPASDVYIVHDISRHVELNRLREQLLYNVAHELRAPLAVLDNALEILAADYGDLSAAEFDHLVRSARRTATRLRALMEDLLSAGSIQSGRFTVRPQPTDVSAIVVDALEVSEHMLQTRGQRVEVHLCDPGLRVHADQQAARQALSNLIDNAAKYSPSQGIIRVRAEQQGGQARLSVADDGPGIAAHEQAALFEQFYRVQNGNGEPGIGLGLAIVKGIVEAHGGRVGVESVEGAGTGVWFTLPLAQEGSPWPPS